MEPNRRGRRGLLVRRLVSVHWRDAVVVGLPLLLVVAAAFYAAVRLVRPAPPDTIRLLSGPEGSSYRSHATKYKKIIEGYGVKVEIVPSKGSLDNLQRLADPRAAADVGFVQGGLTDGIDTSRLVSLGSLFAQPLMVYHRLPEPIERLSELRGKRLAIGPEGSGTRALALKLLAANDVDASSAELVDLAGEEAAHALIAGTVDAAFLSGDSATGQVMRSLGDAGITLMNFKQASGYVRKFHFLSKLTLPEGVFDLGKDFPPTSYDLVGPTVELVARDDLHPALSDLLISAAREIHGRAGLFQDAGTYPTPIERDFRISEDAERYYKAGEQFLYKRLPFWMASLVDRVVVALLPLLVVLVPATRLAPAFYRWRVRSRVYRWYGLLMAIERDILADPGAEKKAEISKRLDDIEHAVDRIKTPLSFADQVYVLREHVGFVRHRMEAGHRA